jgi:hypothetical protein
VVRRFAALAGTIAATVFAGIAAPPATASGALAMPARLSGSLVATWHGDPARGCATAGLCETRGSATYRPGFDGRLTVARNGVSFAGAEGAEPPIVRVRDGAPTAPTACADVLESIFSPLSFAYLGDELQVSLEGLDLSAGRCTGPRTIDLAHALPQGKVKTGGLRRTGRTIDLSARTRFVAGPFSGEVVSTVRVALGRARAARDDLSPEVLRAPRSLGGKRRYWLLDLQYRIAGVSGAIVTDFHGSPDAACRALGACGANGSSSYALKGVSGRIDVLAGGRLPHGRARPSFAAALRRLQAGKLSVYGQSRLWHARATVSESVSSPGRSCADSLFTEPPVVDSRRAAGGLVLLLRSDDLSSLADALRTRCPGPSQSDVLGGASLAHGLIPAAELGAGTLRVKAASRRAFASNGYAGSRSGEFLLDLELVKSGVRVVRG